MHYLIYIKVHRLLDSDTFICNFASVHNTGDLKSNSQYVVEVLTFSFISKGLTKVSRKLFGNNGHFYTVYHCQTLKGN